MNGSLVKLYLYKLTLKIFIFTLLFITNLYMKEKSNKYLITAVILAVLFHGTTIFYTLETTYDALIHFLQIIMQIVGSNLGIISGIPVLL